jgi:hypothetical protein
MSSVRSVTVSYAHAEIVAVKLSSWPDFLNDSMRLTTIRAIEAMARELS